MASSRPPPCTAFSLSVTHWQWQGVTLPPHLPQRLTAYNGVSLVLFFLSFSCQSSLLIGQSPSRQTPVCAVRAASHPRSIRLRLVLTDWPLADDVAPRRLGSGQETEGGGQGAQAVNGDGVAGHVVGADRRQEALLRWRRVAAEGER